jgi:hypothetical protein
MIPEDAMMDSVQAILTIGVPTLAVLVGILINGSRLSDLRSYMDKRLDIMERRSDQRFEDLKETWRAELHRVEEVLDARLKHLEHEG